MSTRQTMAQVQARLAAEKTPHGATAPTGSFAFWNAPAATTTIIHLLPNLDEEALPLPYVDRRSITLPFAGVVGGNYETTADVTVRVPCMETWGQKCYITEQIRPLWSGSEDERNLARQYYRKPAYVYSCLVVSSPIIETPTPENPIRTVALNKSLHERVVAGLTDVDFEFAPWDAKQGRDFKIIKTQQGQWANYSQSAFSYKERALTATELAQIEKYGLRDLSKELGEIPDAATQQAIKDMFHASMAGEPFDANKWPAFKAWPVKGGGATKLTSATPAATAGEKARANEFVGNLRSSRVSSTTADAAN